MSDGASVAYRLRPNKAVDRELFLSLLVRLAAELRIEKYAYIGLGGAFLEEFRLIHARTGISRMTCIERNLEVHKRQKFNRPIATVECVHGSLDEYLDSSEHETPVVVWLDYTSPDEMQSQIDCFCRQLARLPIRSVVRLTLNANPSSLGTPKPDEFVQSPFGTKTSSLPTLQEWRLQKLRERLSYCPSSISPTQLETKAFGPTLLEIVKLSLEKYLEGVFDRKVIWAFATHYSDGQPMVTATAIIADKSDTTIEPIVNEWEFREENNDLIVIDLPALSTRERLHLEASDDAKNCLDYALPKSSLKTDTLARFSRLYRVFPHFATVDL
jgi:hypothetical protein